MIFVFNYFFQLFFFIPEAIFPLIAIGHHTAAWWDNLMNGESPEREWKDNLRMSRGDFMALVVKLRPYLSPDSESF